MTDMASVKPARPILRLILRPSVAFMPMNGDPLVVTATALLLDPEGQVECPGWVMFWGDGEKSIEAPETCNLEEIEKPRDRRTWTVAHPYKRVIGSGVVEVVMMDLADPDAFTMRQTARMTIRAEGPHDKPTAKDAAKQSCAGW